MEIIAGRHMAQTAVRIFIACYLVFSLSGCADIPIKDGGLVVGKDTTAGIDDVGVARITNQF